MTPKDVATIKSTISKQDNQLWLTTLNYKPPCIQRFLRQKKKVHRVLVLNLNEISKELIIFIDLKITEVGSFLDRTAAGNCAILIFLCLPSNIKFLM